MHLYSGTMRTLIEETFPVLTIASADEALAHLRGRKTACETERIRTACRIAERAFERAPNRSKPERASGKRGGFPSTVLVRVLWIFRN